MRIFIFLLLLCGRVQAANLDAKLMVISDLHHSQSYDEITMNLAPMLELYKTYGADGCLGLGDLINRNTGAEGPITANVSDLVAAFGSMPVKNIACDHDMADAGDFWEVGAELFPGERWTWDLGDKWRVISINTDYLLGWILTPDDLVWLEDQLSTARADDRYVVIATHQRAATDIPANHDQILTPSGTTGTVTVTSTAAGAFPLPIGGTLFLRHGTCTDTSCWGWGKVSAIAGDGLSATLTVEDAFVNTSAATYWNYNYWEMGFYNSQEIRAILENYADKVKLCVSGHAHENGFWNVNGIDYIQFESLRSAPSGGGVAKSGGLLHLYVDGSWKLQGTGGQSSHNWGDFYLDQSFGDDAANSGAFAENSWKTLSKAAASLTAGQTLHIVSDLTGGISLNGSSGSPIVIKSHGERIKIFGQIGGEYLQISDIDTNIGNLFTASNSATKGMRSIP